jgi:hypothetical protein
MQGKPRSQQVPKKSGKSGNKQHTIPAPELYYHLPSGLRVLFRKIAQGGEASQIGVTINILSKYLTDPGLMQETTHDKKTVDSIRAVIQYFLDPRTIQENMGGKKIVYKCHSTPGNDEYIESEEEKAVHQMLEKTGTPCGNYHDHRPISPTTYKHLGDLLKKYDTLSEKIRVRDLFFSFMGPDIPPQTVQRQFWALPVASKQNKDKHKDR